MYRRHVALPPFARAFQAGALLLILLGILGLLVHSIAVEHRGGQVAGSAKLQAR